MSSEIQLGNYNFTVDQGEEFLHTLPESIRFGKGRNKCTIHEAPEYHSKPTPHSLRTLLMKNDQSPVILTYDGEKFAARQNDNVMSLFKVPGLKENDDELADTTTPLGKFLIFLNKLITTYDENYSHSISIESSSNSSGSKSFQCGNWSFVVSDDTLDYGKTAFTTALRNNAQATVRNIAAETDSSKLSYKITLRGSTSAHEFHLIISRSENQGQTGIKFEIFKHGSTRESSNKFTAFLADTEISSKTRSSKCKLVNEIIEFASKQATSKTTEVTLKTDLTTKQLGDVTIEALGDKALSLIEDSLLNTKTTLTTSDSRSQIGYLKYKFTPKSPNDISGIIIVASTDKVTNDVLTFDLMVIPADQAKAFKPGQPEFRIKIPVDKIDALIKQKTTPKALKFLITAAYRERMADLN